jgi:NifB/MoaA-like Fe-S oxidoreductase
MRPHTVEEARAVVDTVGDWQDVFRSVLGRRLVFAADEYYLLAGRPFPEADAYEGFPQHENGIGMARAFEMELHGKVEAEAGIGVQPGFFAWVDGAPAEGYRARRTDGLISLTPRPDAPIAVLTGDYGAAVIEPLVAGLDVRVLPVPNTFFGGNIGVTGLMVGTDIARVLADQPEGHRYLLPDVCLSAGLFLDGTKPEDLPRPVEIIRSDGISLRQALKL